MHNFDFQMKKDRTARSSALIVKRQTTQQPSDAQPPAAPTSRQNQIGQVQLNTRPTAVNTARTR